MPLLLDTLTAYARLSLIVALLTGAAWHWRTPRARRPFLYVLVPCLVVYGADGLRLIGLFGFLEDCLYAQGRFLVAITAVSLAYWTMLVVDIWRKP